MKYRNTGNGIICKDFFLVNVCYLSNLEGFMSVMSHSLLGGREHQITHANVDIELNGV